MAKNGNFGHLPEYPAYVASSSSRTSNDGRTFYQTQYGWMDGADLQPLTPSTFTGILLTRDVPFRFGWVLADTTSVNAAGAPVRAYTRYQLVHEIKAVTQNPGFVSIGADEWLPQEQVALVDPQVPADAGADTCRFIYVNLAQETLTVYNNCKLIFATLVSSGKNSWTFEGRFAILTKDTEYRLITPPAESTSKFYIEGVPIYVLCRRFWFPRSLLAGQFWGCRLARLHQPVTGGCEMALRLGRDRGTGHHQRGEIKDRFSALTILRQVPSALPALPG